jgi:hypothetical protein
MAREAETPPPVTRLISQAQTARAQSAAVRSQSAAERWRSQALRSRSVAVISRSHALRSWPVRSQALAARRGQAGGPVFVSPATVRAQRTLTYRDLAAAARRRAIDRARELGLLDG